jgi:hypothetical protein
VHGFHAYPARLHPTLARRLIELLAPAEGVVLDPFCGSGTVLVEARLAGRRGLGFDLNPLAIALALLKSQQLHEREREAILQAGRSVAEHAESRRHAKAGATRRYPETDVRLFDPHVLLELDGLRDGISKVPAGIAKDALWLVLSSMLVKVGRKRGDTGDADDAPRRLAAGFVTRFFGRKVDELVRRLADFARLLPTRSPNPEAWIGDARDMHELRERSVDLVVCSPPYAGNYDYAAHHDVRLRWLGLNGTLLDQQEIGARRNLEPLGRADAVRQFAEDLRAALCACGRAARPGSHAALVIADSVVAQEPVWAEPLVVRATDASPWTWLATASQVRPHFHRPSAAAFRRKPRREHVILLRHRGTPKAPKRSR